MARKKKVESIKGNHLTVNADGSLSWDWSALLKEVQEATAIKKDLVAETEAKVKRTRKKKPQE